MAPRLRRLLMAASALALAVLLLMAISVFLLLRPDRFTAMLQEQAHQAGLVLNLDSPASPTVLPRPALELHGITLGAEGSDGPILFATSGRLVLPWSTLLGGRTAITQMEVDGPRVDLDALQSWLATRPQQPANAPPVLPSIDTGIRIEHGSLVHGDELLFDNVTLTAGTLTPDRQFPLDMSATTASGAPLQMHLTTTPRIHGNALQLDDIQLHLSQGSGTTLALRGHAHWRGGANADAQLGGKLDQADAGSYDVALTLTPADQSDPLLLHLKLDGPANHADMSLPPLALAHWWGTFGTPSDPQAAVQPGLPPGNGTLHLSKLQIGSLGITGLSVQAGDSVPAAASSAASKPGSDGASK